jgi:hypothetical protein
MRLSANRSRTACACLLALAACSAASKTPSRLNALHDGAGSNATGGSAAAASGDDGSAGSTTGNDNADNPPGIVTTSGGSGGMAGVAGDAAGASGDGCVVGQFCKPAALDGMDCGHTDLTADTKTITKPGNVLVVFDRSTSMLDDWNGMPKYQSAGNALISALTPLKDLLTVGGVFFPSPAAAPTMVAADDPCAMGCDVANPLHWIPGPGACCLNTAGGLLACDVNTIDKADQLNFASADSFITNLPMHWTIPGTNGTPLEAGIVSAAAAISANMFTDPLIVVLMTDGEPNCNTNTTNVINQVTAWNAAGIATHVVGLPGAQGAATLLDMIAQAGGTNTYIDPMDPTELQMRLTEVITSTVKVGFDSCTFHLDPKADVPDKLHLIVTEQGVDMDVPRDLSADATWSINAAGDEVVLAGQLCDFAMNGTFEGIRFSYGCVTAPPLPPPPAPPMPQ